MKQVVNINNREIGKEYPVYFIAEMSAHHLQDFDRAKDIIKAAKEAGADAIKLQTYRPDTITVDCRRGIFGNSGKSLGRHEFV